MLLLAACTAAADPSKPVLIQVGACTPGQTYAVDFNCPELLATPGLPAIDAKQARLAVPIREDHNLFTLPTLAVQLVSAADGKPDSTIAVWSYDDAHKWAVKMEGSNKPEDLDKVTAEVKARVATATGKLAGFTPLAACTHDDHSAPSGRACPGFDRWSCGALALAYDKDHRAVALAANGKTKSIAAAAWRRTIDVDDGGGPTKADTVNCITDVRAIPGTTRLALELSYRCDVGGDGCGGGETAWHVVGL